MTHEPWILVLGTADWDQAIATNQHNVARELAQDFRVTFVESIGLRRVELSRRDLRRIGHRLKRRTGGPTIRSTRPRPSRLEVLSPLVIPYHSGVPRVVNTYLIHRLVRAWLDHPGTRILWTYSPVTYGLEKFSNHVFYHCVDLLAEVPGIPSVLVDGGERRLARLGAHAVGSSEVVVNHLNQQGFVDPEYWPNVADVDLIRSVRPPPGVDNRSNRVVFAGNLSKLKVDFELLRRLSASGVELHLAGPIAEGGGEASDEVKGVVAAGAIYHGMLPLEDLARLYWSASVGLIPYLMNSYTLGVNPLKTFEYMAAGMAVVSTPVPAVRSGVGDVIVVDSTEGFISAVHDHSHGPDRETCERRSQLAEQHSWRRRGQEARDLVHAAATPARSQ